MAHKCISPKLSPVGFRTEKKASKAHGTAQQYIQKNDEDIKSSFLIKI
jgi:hypothetical protein